MNESTGHKISYRKEEMMKGVKDDKTKRWQQWKMDKMTKNKERGTIERKRWQRDRNERIKRQRVRNDSKIL